MVAPRQDSEPPVVTASRWVSRITTISLEMALPAGFGYWLDTRWGTTPWLVLVGAGLGLFTAAMSLKQLIQQASPPPRPPRDKLTSQSPTDSGTSE
jgi:ATP synthase protein I